MSRPKTTPALESMPPEVRLCIYEYLLRTSIFQFNTKSSTGETSPLAVFHYDPPVSTSLLRVCKLLHQEAHPVLLQKNTFQFLQPLSDLRFSPLPASFLACLRTVVIGPFQSTAKNAVGGMAATRLFIQSACPGLERLSSRHWLVKHTGAEIEDAERGDLAPVLDTTYHYNRGRGGLAAGDDRQPWKYTMGIWRSILSTEAKDQRPGDLQKMASMDVYSILNLNLVEEDKRPDIFDTWAKVSTRALLKLVETEGEKLKGLASRSGLKDLTPYLSVNSAIEEDWSCIAGELGHYTLIP